jgi:hypothetical protein
MAKDAHISGIGGWLLFLIIGLMVLGPLAGFGNLSSAFSDALEQHPQLASNSQWQTYRNASWVIFFSVASVGFFAGYRLWQNHYPGSVHFAIVALWIIGPTRTVLDVASAAVIFGSLRGQDQFPEIIGSIIGSCIGSAIWTAYLLRSKRVTNTYGM